MVRVFSIRRTTPADFKLTKLFGIDDFSVAKDFGKVFIIIIYCFYNYFLGDFSLSCRTFSSSTTFSLECFHASCVF